VVIRNRGAVPESLRERFFDKYATSGKQTGTGLGTYSSLLFAEAQRGCVELEASEPGATTLIVRLPRPKAGGQG
jgi:nitrogen-specific signal transduction histidine kinase